LLGDALRLEQVLSYLVNNTIKFTEQGSIAIHVELVWQDDDWAHLRFVVADMGIGLSKGEIAHLTSEFT